ncbi:MAG: TIGR02466 family protein [Pseudomonadota bacterium]
MDQISLFSTRIERATLSDTPSLEQLEAACWMIEDGDTAGHQWCEDEGYPGYTSYASLDDLPDRAPAFADLLNVLDKMAAGFADRLHWDLGEAKLRCDSLWINILGEGGHHSGHIHPNSVISGTCYICVPDGAGRIKFEDPRLPMMMAAPPVKADAPAEAKRFCYIAPVAGDVLMWESWLRHEVMPSQTDEARISVSYNYSLV